MATNPSLEQLLEGISPQKLEQPCKGYHLAKIALHMTKWQSISPYLKLGEIDEEQIIAKFPNDLKAQKIAMLRRWKAKRGERATYMKLARVLLELGQVSLVEEVCKILSESSSSESEGEGEYSKVNNKACPVVTCSMLRYNDYLKGKYRMTRPSDLSLQWPPPPTHIAFNLALIQKERLEYGPNEEMVRLLQRGEVNEVADSRTEVELSNLMMADDEQRKVILIEGAPGSGKSTLAWHICQKWEKGELFTEYEVLVFIQLRDLVVQSTKSISDILPVDSDAMAIEVMSLFQSRYGKGVLLVLDGWDELQPGSSAHSLLLQLIRIPDSINMHFSSVIITSRPVTSGEIQRHASSRIEVLGFKHEEVQKYLKCCFGKNEQLYTNFIEQLRERPVIEASCFLPLNAVIVVHTFCACNYSLPSTLHGVFEEIVLSSIQRHTQAKMSKTVFISSSSLNELPPDLKTPLLALSCLAFHCVMKNKVIFSREDLETFKIPVDMTTTLSLVQVFSNFGKRDKSKSYSFFHLQVQELLAAYHISQLEEEEQVSIFQQLFGQPRFVAVFQFYAAFTKLRIKGIREVLSEMVKQNKYMDAIIQCMYEAQDPLLCQFVGFKLFSMSSMKDNTFYFHVSEYSSPLYLIALGYFLKCYCYYCNSELPLEIQDLPSYNIRKLVSEFNKTEMLKGALLQEEIYGSLKILIRVGENLGMLVQELLEPLKLFVTTLTIVACGMQEFKNVLEGGLDKFIGICSNLRRFYLRVTGLFENEITHKNLSLITQSVSHCKYFKKLEISTTGLGNTTKLNVQLVSTVKYLTLRGCKLIMDKPISDTFQFSVSLKVLHFSDTCLDGVEYFLLMGLASNTSVVELILKNCRVKFTDNNGELLKTMLTTNKTLRSLTISGYDATHTSVDMKSMCNGLVSNTSIFYLDIRGCFLSLPKSNDMEIVHMLEDNTSLKTLLLDNRNRLFDEIIDHVIQGLAKNVGLEVLSVVCTASQIRHLADTLMVNTSLMSLNMSFSLSSSVFEFVHIARCFEVNTTLRNLKARSCRIPAHALQPLPLHHSSLEAIDISGNRIGNEGAGYIAELIAKSNIIYQVKLRECDIGDSGVQSLANAMEKSSSLEIIDISVNKFSGIGLQSIGMCLKKNRTLKSLNIYNIYGNTYTIFDIKVFLTSLYGNEYLTDLYFNNLFGRDEINFHNEVRSLNQVRKEKNRDMLKVQYFLW